MIARSPSGRSSARRYSTTPPNRPGIKQPSLFEPARDGRLNRHANTSRRAPAPDDQQKRTRPNPSRSMHRRDVSACELGIGGNPSTLAVATGNGSSDPRRDDVSLIDERDPS